MDETKLKEARSNVINQIVELSKQTDYDLDAMRELLATVERIDQLLVNRRP